MQGLRAACAQHRIPGHCTESWLALLQPCSPAHKPFLSAKCCSALLWHRCPASPSAAHRAAALQLGHTPACGCPLSWQWHWGCCKAMLITLSGLELLPSLTLQLLCTPCSACSPLGLGEGQAKLTQQFSLMSELWILHQRLGQAACELRHRHLLRSLGTITMLVFFGIWSSSKVVSN